MLVFIVWLSTRFLVFLNVALCVTQCNAAVFQVSKAACILTTQPLMRILRSREAAASVNIKTWPTIIDTGRVPHSELCHTLQQHGPLGPLLYTARYKEHSLSYKGTAAMFVATMPRSVA